MIKLNEIYSVQSIKSSCENIEWKDWPTALQGFTEGSWVLATLHYGVFAGRVSKGTIEWLPDYGTTKAGMPENENGFPEVKQVVELRIFNTNKEVFFWREEASLKGRLRQDGIGSELQRYTETEMAVRGVVAKKLFTTFNTKDDTHIFLVTRNYIMPNAIQQMGYVDCRFVDFKI